MSDTLGEFQKSLNRFIADAAAKVDAERLEQERLFASAMESLSQESACQAAYCDGRSDERNRCLALIDDHLHCLSRTSISTLALEALRDSVRGE